MAALLRKVDSVRCKELESWSGRRSSPMEQTPKPKLVPGNRWGTHFFWKDQWGQLEGNLVDKDENVDGTVCQLLLRQAVVDEDLDCVGPDDGEGDDRGHGDRRAERQLQQNRSLVIHHELDEPEQLGSERRIHFFVRNLKMLRTSNASFCAFNFPLSTRWFRVWI